ncbi:hypothetical protein HN873_032409, partial [Arachis hypogaea]
ALASPNPDAEAFLFAETPPTDPEGNTALTQKREHNTTSSPTNSTGQHSTTPAATHSIRKILEAVHEADFHEAIHHYMIDEMLLKLNKDGLRLMR